MNWTTEAEEAIRKTPFFVRKKVRARVEDEARKAGKSTVSLTDVRLTQKRYLTKMSDKIKGYQLETCFGTGGCPNRAMESDRLFERLEEILKEANILAFLKKHVREGLKHHHEFRVTLSDCPNACSQPQIKDMGIIGAVEPMVTDEFCSLCRACVDACIEKAVTIEDIKEMPGIDHLKCIKYGQCIRACPTGTLAIGRKGYRILLGGKLGRHPRLAEEIQGIHSEEEVVEILNGCLSMYKKRSRHGERFAEIFQDLKIHDQFIAEISRK